MKIGKRFAAVLLILALMAGCQSIQAPDSSASYGSDDESEAVSKIDQIETEKGTVLIKTADDLRELSRIANSGGSSYLETTYLLGNDIDMAGENLEPIGQFFGSGGQDSDVDGFNAIFDGQGYAIRNLKISRTMTEPELPYNTGLFALIGRHGQVKNLRLEDCDVSFVTGGEASLGGNATGGLAGTSFGAVTNCSVTGKITGSYQVGGLIGASGQGSTVDGCSADAFVTGESEIGAFIGTLHDAFITNCSVSGEVTAVNLPGGYDRPRGIGGFSGFMVMGTVSDCMSSAYVKTADSSDWVGGFMGYNQGEIINCFYDSSKTAGWEPVDVSYQGAVSDVKDVSERNTDESAENGKNESPSQKDSLTGERLNEIMCIFGAERKVEYDEQGHPIESDIEEYQTAVISFYYDEDGISGADDITPYGFFGWYLMYTLLQDEQIIEVFPEFERMTLIRNDPVSGEIYGAPGDVYEAIVTSFFDVDVRQLRGDGLYDEEAHAYVPITGPGIGERPTVRVAAMEQKDGLIILDISIEGSSPLTLQLTVREDKSNELAGIKFVNLRNKL